MKPQITDAAFNALLKTLEEPPSHIVFMMGRRNRDIPQTIRSRCQHFSFHAVRFDDIVQQLRDIAKQRESKPTTVHCHAGEVATLDARRPQHHGPAIACCGNTLSGDVVRGLVGTFRPMYLRM